MGTTDTLNLPFPGGSDFVIEGDNAIEALADAVDAALTTAAVLPNIESRANDTFALADGFDLDLDIGKWIIEFEFVWEAADAASGAKFRWHQVGDSIGDNYFTGHALTRDDAGGVNYKIKPAGGGEYVDIGFGTDGHGIDGPPLVTTGRHLYVVRNDSVQLRMQWAQNTNHGTVSRLFKGSFMHALQIAD